MLKITSLQKKFGSLEVIKDVSTTVEKGEIISIIGPSGTGKSTFLRCINLLEVPTSGKIELNGISITDKNTSIDNIRKQIGMVFQGFNLFSHLTVIENIIAAPIKLLKMPKADAKKLAMELLEQVGLSEKANAYPNELSGGQKQRVAIARTLAMKPEIILFDEPTSALDPTKVGEVTMVIKALSTMGMTMMIVTHEMEFAKNISTRIFYMDEGGIYEEGTPKEIFDAPKKEKTRRFIQKIKSFSFTAQSSSFDYVKTMNDFVNFCNSYIDGRKNIHKAELNMEELLTLLKGKDDINLEFSFPENQQYYEFNLSYGNEKENILDSDTLSATIITKSSKEINYKYEVKNYINIKW